MRGTAEDREQQRAKNKSRDLHREGKIQRRIQPWQLWWKRFQVADLGKFLGFHFLLRCQVGLVTQQPGLAASESGEWTTRARTVEEQVFTMAS